MENNNLNLQLRNNENRGNYDLTTNGNRPLSSYDNTMSNKSSPNNKTSKFDKSRTQMHFLATTVPQNIATQNIAGKHAPTRNSLRHSRMIVLNRSGQAITPSLPPFIKYYKFVKTLLVFITFLGTVLCTLSLLLLLWTPNIRPKDNPYWSAVPVIFSGIIGFIFLYSFPRKRPGTRCSYWISTIKFISIFASSMAAVITFTICSFAVIHLIMLATMTCSPPDKVNTTCLCSTNSSQPTSTISYHYIDLTCTEVNNFLYVIILFSCITNAIVSLAEILYLYIHWLSRKDYTYSRVQTTHNLNKLNSSYR